MPRVRDNDNDDEDRRRGASRCERLARPCPLLLFPSRPAISLGREPPRGFPSLPATPSAPLNCPEVSSTIEIFMDSCEIEIRPVRSQPWMRQQARAFPDVGV